MPKQLTNLRIDEVSSVDRGAGKGVRVALLKRQFSGDERRSAADSGAALPDGSFPIKSKEDLKNAIQAIGRAKDPAKAKAHIKTRARALGASDMIPDTWKRDDQATIDKALTLAIGSLIAEGGQLDEFVELFKQFHTFLGADAQSEEIDMDAKELAKLVSETIASTVPELIGKALADRGIFEKMTKDHQNYFSNLDGDEAKRFQHMDHGLREKYMKDHPIRGDEGKAPPETGDADSEGDKEARKVLAKLFGDDVADKMIATVAKSAPKKLESVSKADVATDVAKAIEPFKKQIDELTKQNKTLVEKDQIVEFGKRAVALGLQESDGEMLRKAHLGDPEALKKMEDMIAALRKQAATGDLFKEFGSGGGSSGGAHEQLVAKATEYRKAHASEKLTVEQAYDKVYNDPENAALAQQERNERMAKINKQAA